MVDYTFTKFGSLIKQMFITFEGLFTGKLSVKQLTGPIGIYNVVGEQRKQGIENVLYLITLLSVNIGFLNLLPIPALDGGKVVFLAIEKIKGSPVKPNVENMIHLIGFGLLILLMVVVAFNDVLNLL